VGAIDRAPWSRIAIAAPGVAAAIVAVVALLNGSPQRASVRPGPIPRIVARPVPSPGPPPLVAAGRRRVPMPTRFEGSTGVFLTVEGAVARVVPSPRRRGVVALTFDDGPGPLTDEFVRRLRKLHVTATFFVVGTQVVRRPAVLRRTRAAGMAIGNHSWSHRPMRALRPREQRDEIDYGDEAIQGVIGYRPLFFRPPYKSYNLATAREIAAAGMVGGLYDVDPRDWRKPGVRTIVRRALAVKPGGVILLHDWGGDRRQTLAALPRIVRALRRRHLEPVSLDDLYRPASPP
jgi:peptidoglycan/xylan/chitin deacetylase (PgdA/CDA1 family)